MPRALPCGTGIGYVETSPTFEHEFYWSAVQLIDRDSPAAITVSQLLWNSLTVAGSRRLALADASGMLGLHGTPWLQKQWSWKVIMLFKKSVRISSDHPCVSAALPSADHSVMDSVMYFEENAFIRNPTMPFRHIVDRSRVAETFQ